jgi:hypothetical protein
MLSGLKNMFLKSPSSVSAFLLSRPKPYVFWNTSSCKRQQWEPGRGSGGSSGSSGSSVRPTERFFLGTAAAAAAAAGLLPQGVNLDGTLQ